MITVNKDFLNKCYLGISKDGYKYYLQGVCIRDIDGVRHYCGTNGHILIHCQEPITDDSIGDNEIIVQMDKVIKTKLDRMQMIVNDDFVTFKADKPESFNIIDGTFPDFFRVIPQNRVKPSEFTMFDYKYLKTVHDVFDKDIVNLDITMENHTTPAVFTSEDVEGVEVILMPLVNKRWYND